MPFGSSSATLPRRGTAAPPRPRQGPATAPPKQDPGQNGAMDATQNPTTAVLLEQLTWHWDNHLRPRLEGMADDEYLWRPTPDAWTIHFAESAAPTIDFAYPPPDPAPVTTIAWRLAHVIVGCLGARAANHFGGPPVDYFTFPYSPTATGALDQLDEAYARWVAGVSSLSDADLQRPVGPTEGPWAEHSMGTLVAHINREVIHHGAEMCLLRDLYAHGPDLARP